MPRREEKDEKVKLKKNICRRIFAKARNENFFFVYRRKNFFAIENATTNGKFLEIEIKLKAKSKKRGREIQSVKSKEREKKLRDFIDSQKA